MNLFGRNRSVWREQNEMTTRVLETPSERTASEANESSVYPEVEVVTLSPSMQLRMRAAQLLREKGWCQGSASITTRYGTRYCMIGALSVAWQQTWGQNVADMQRGRPVWEIAISELGGQETIPTWNDAPGRTKEQVIALLEGRDWEAERR